MALFMSNTGAAWDNAKKYIEEGAIGEILNFRGTYLQDWSADPNSPLSWRFQKGIAGSGAVGDIGSHVVDLARYLVGEISEVTSVVSTFIPDRPLQSSGFDALGGSVKNDGPRGAVDVDDEAMSLVRFRSGAVGSIGDSVCCIRDHYTRVIGSRASLVMTGEHEETVLRLHREGAKDSERIPAQDTKREGGGLDHFFECIREGRPSENDLRSARHSLEVALAMRESARCGKPMAIGG